MQILHYSLETLLCKCIFTEQVEKLEQIAIADCRVSCLLASLKLLPWDPIPNGDQP